MTLHQNVTVAVNPLYLDSPEAQGLIRFFQMLGVATADIVLTPATPESGSTDPSVAFTVEYDINLNVCEGTRYGYVMRYTVTVEEATLTHFKRRMKTIRDGFISQCQRNIMAGLLSDAQFAAAGTFELPAGYADFNAYLQAVLQGSLDTLPSIDV